MNASASLTVQPTMFNQEEKTCELFTGNETIAVSWYEWQILFLIKSNSPFVSIEWSNKVRSTNTQSHRIILEESLRKENRNRTWKILQKLCNTAWLNVSFPKRSLTRCQMTSCLPVSYPSFSELHTRYS